MTSTSNIGQPATAEPRKGPADRKLTGTMSTFDIVFTVLAFNAPLSVFAGYLTVVIGYANGLGAPMTYILAGAVVLVFAVGFTTMSKHLPNPGAFYAYITAGLGRPLGLGAAFLALASYVFLYVSSFIYGGTAIASLVKDTLAGPDIPWWAYNIALIALVGVLGYFRITLSAKILMVAMCLEVIIIVIYDAVVAFQGGSEGYTSAPFHLDNVFSGSIGLAALFGIGMFSGFEATAVFREEARNPEKTIPRATYITIGVVALLYAATSFAIITGVGPSIVVESSAADPVGTVMGSVAHYLGKVGQDVAMVLLCTSIFAAVLAMHNITARYLFSMGRDRVFPRQLGNVHESHDSPHVASFVTTAIASLFLAGLLITGADGSALYAKLAGIALYALIMLLLLTSAAIPAYFWLRPGHGLSPMKTIVAPVLAGIGFIGALILATQNSAFLVGGSTTAARSLIAFFYVMVLAGVVYALVLKRRRPEVYARIGRQDD